MQKHDSLPSLQQAVKPSGGGFGGDATESLTGRSCTQSELDAWAHEDSASGTIDSHNVKSRKTLGRNRVERMAQKLSIVTNPMSETNTPVP